MNETILGLMKRFALPIAGLLGAVVLLSAFRSNDDLFELRKNFEVFGALYEEIALGYVDDVRPTPFMRAGIDAMLEQLDPYTHFYDEAAMVDSRILQQQNLGGVGLSIGRKGGRLSVLAPDGEATAYQKGVRPGDIILQIGETSTDGLTVMEATNLLLGQPGTVVQILIQRTGEVAPRSFVLPRIKPRAVNVSRAGWLGADSSEAIAYVRLDRFGNRAGREVKRAFRTLNRSVPLHGMVLDLRGNPGGLLSEAVNVVGNFAPKGSLVVTTRSRIDGVVQEFRTDEDPLFPDVPLVILVNEYSASASEIVSGALQDMDRAVIMGTTSLGKGLVQVLKPLPHNTTLKLTVSHYFLPTGRTIQSARYSSESATATNPTLLEFETAAGRTVRGGRGVEPDVSIEVEPPGQVENALQRESAFFLFANEWVATRCQSNETCSASGDEKVSAFLEWLDRSHISITTEFDLSLSALELESVETGFDGITDELERLKTAVEVAKSDQLASIEDRILMHIQHEIDTRLLEQSDQISEEIASDGWISQAQALLQEEGRLEALLR